MSKVILYSPVRLDPEILSLSLRAHSNLEGVSEWWYTCDNTDVASMQLLYDVGDVPGVRLLPSLPDSSESAFRGHEVPHVWNQKSISRVAQMKNFAIAEFLKTDADYLFLVDADVILNPETVKHLLSLGKSIVSEVFWTNWQEDGLYAPQVWDVHPYGHHTVENIIRLREKGQYDVGGLGACTLIKREVLDDICIGFNWFNPISSVNLEGEDRHFCIRASTHGWTLTADTHYPPFHVYRQSQLEEATVWLGAGAPPEYFRETWLTDEWVEILRKQEVYQRDIHSGKQPAPGARQRLAICLPGETFTSKYVTNLLSVYEYALRNFDVRVFHGYSSDAAITRWALTNELLSNYASGGAAAPDYVLWVDDDNVVSADDVKTLVEDLQAHAQLDIVAGWCLCTTGKPSVGTFDSEGYLVPLTEQELAYAHGLLGIDWTGFPCVLMRGSLLATLGAKAWTRLPDQYGKLPWGYFGEDASFCKQALSVGARAAVDPRVKVPHLKVGDYNGATRPLTEKTQKEKEEEIA